MAAAAGPAPTNSIAFIPSDVLQPALRSWKIKSHHYVPVPLSKMAGGLPGSGLAVMLSVALRDFFANGLKLTA